MQITPTRMFLFIVAIQLKRLSDIFFQNVIFQYNPKCIIKIIRLTIFFTNQSKVILKNQSRVFIKIV